MIHEREDIADVNSRFRQLSGDHYRRLHGFNDRIPLSQAASPDLHQRPILFQVVKGRLSVVEADGHASEDAPVFEAGDIMGDLGHPVFGEFGEPGDPQSNLVLWARDTETHFRLLSPQQSLEFLLDPAAFAYVRLVSQKRAGRDPLLEVLHSKLPYVFGSVGEWPRAKELRPEFRIYNEGEHIFRMLQIPQAIYVVLHGAVQLVDDSGHSDRVFALLKSGDLFGELERPIPSTDGGRVLPTMLSAKAGLSGTDYMLQRRYPKTLAFMISYSQLKDLSNEVGDPHLLDRLSDYSRATFWSWWPRLMGATSTYVHRMMAGVLLQRVYQEWMRELTNTSSLIVSNSTPGDYIHLEEFHDKFWIDWREAVVTASGGQIRQSTWKDSFVQLLRKLEELHIVSFDLSRLVGGPPDGPNRLRDNEEVLKQLKGSEPYEWQGLIHALHIGITVHNVSALRELAYGEEKLTSVGEEILTPTKFSITRCWDRLADYWTERIRSREDSFRTHILDPLIMDKLKEHLGSFPDKKLLDAGCGEGYLSRLLAEAGASVTGVDVSGKLIQAAKRLGCEGDCNFIQADLGDLPSGDELQGFDAVVGNMVLMDVPDYKAVINTSTSRLVDGGVGIWTIVNPGLADDDTGRWWLDKPNEDKDIKIQIPRHQGLWARYVRLALDAPAKTVYYQRRVADYQRAFEDASMEVNQVYPSVPAELGEETIEAITNWGVESPVVCFVTIKPVDKSK